MQMHRGEGSSLDGFLIATLFLAENIAPELDAGIGSHFAARSPSFSSVAFLDIGFDGRSHGRGGSRCLRRSFRSGASNVFPRRPQGLFEGQGSIGRLVVDVVGGADGSLLVVAAFVVIAPPDEPNSALFSFAIAKVRFRIEAAPWRCFAILKTARGFTLTH